MDIRGRLVKWKIEKIKAKAASKELFSLFFTKYINDQFSSMTDSGQMQRYFDIVKKIDKN